MGDTLNDKQAEILKEINQMEEAKAVTQEKLEWGAIVEGGEKDNTATKTEKPKKKKRVEKAESKTEASTKPATPTKP